MRIITLFIIIVASSLVLTYGKNCPDTLYTRLLKTPIIKMTDGEYRYFREYENTCENYVACIDSQIIWLDEKMITEMTENEADYYIDRKFDCDTFNPCSLKQYSEIKNKNEFEMSNQCCPK